MRRFAVLTALVLATLSLTSGTNFDHPRCLWALKAQEVARSLGTCPAPPPPLPLPLPLNPGKNGAELLAALTTLAQERAFEVRVPLVLLPLAQATAAYLTTPPALPSVKGLAIMFTASLLPLYVLLLCWRHELNVARAAATREPPLSWGADAWEATIKLVCVGLIATRALLRALGVTAAVRWALFYANTAAALAVTLRRERGAVPFLREHMAPFLFVVVVAVTPSLRRLRQVVLSPFTTARLAAAAGAAMRWASSPQGRRR